jgi:hypothetical protein
VYHIQGIHPQLLAAFDDVGVRYEQLGHHSRMYVPFSVASARLGPDVAPLEILQAMFGSEDTTPPEETSNAQDRLSSASGALGDYFSAIEGEHAQQAGPMALFDQYRDETGDIVLPDGVTLRGILKEAARMGAAAQGIDFPGISDDAWVDDWLVLVFPNTILSVTTSSVLYMRFLPDWDDPNRCRWDISTLEWVTDARRAAEVRAPHRIVGEKEETLGLILDQDVYQMPRTHRGLQSAALDHVTLSRLEIQLIHFNQVLDRHLAER